MIIWGVLFGLMMIMVFLEKIMNWEKSEIGITLIYYCFMGMCATVALIIFLYYLQFALVDENGIVVQSSKDTGVGDINGRVHSVAQMSLKATKEVAGKTLTLYVYDYDATSNQTLYDINTQIKVTVEKQDLAEMC